MQTGGGKQESKFIYDAIASASIVQNGAGVETSRSRVLTLSSLANFLKTQQGERKSEVEIIAIIEVRSLIYNVIRVLYKQNIYDNRIHLIKDGN